MGRTSRTSSAAPRTRNLGLLALRAAVGGTLAAHGAQKLFGAFGGGGIEGTGAFLESQGFVPGDISAVLAGLGEFGGGSLLALGLATPLGGAAGAATMSVAASTHVPNGFWNTQGGLELPAVLGTAAASLALTGAGAYSLDHLFRGRLAPAWLAPVALVGAAAAAAAVIARSKAQRESPEALQGGPDDPWAGQTPDAA